VEELESRWSPATLVNASTVTWQDVDGDTVSCKLSRPLLTPANSGDVFTFSPNLVTPGNGRQTLTALNLFNLGPAANGIGVTIQSTQAGTGDGLVNIGAIEATSASVNLDLGAVVVDGDLGRINAGDGNTSTTGLASLTVRSLGRLGTTTGSPDLVSQIQGPLGALRVATDIDQAQVEVHSAGIGRVTIGGSLLGGAAKQSGFLSCDGNVGRVTIGGSVIGGGGEQSGATSCSGSVTSVSIKGDLIGAEGESSGTVTCGGALGSVTVGGSIRGGRGDFSGVITADSLARVTIKHDLAGGAGSVSGRVGAGTSLGPVLIGGDLLGGAGNFSGELGADNLVTGVINGLRVGVSIGGDIRGGPGRGSANISSSGNLAAVTVGGSIFSGSGPESGEITAGQALGAVVVKGNVVGTSLCPVLIAAVQSSPALGNLTIQSVLIGGRAEFADILGGFNFGGEPENAGVRIGRVTVGGDCIASNIVAGIDPTDGHFGDRSDQVIRGGNPALPSTIDSITIGGTVLGTPGNVATTDSFGFEAQQIGAVTIRSIPLPLRAGPDNDSGVPLGVTGDLLLREL
jgi:hypothetical protein